MSTFLRPRKQLLVLDNFEHVLPAAPVIGRLLRAAPGLSVLVTSQSLLHLSGEHDMPVPGMGLSTSKVTSKKQALENDAVRLFADRAQALSPSFEVTDENAADVLALCQRLDGLPLAIELAAARIRRDTPRSMLERLSQSGALQVLGHGFHDAERRQQTLRETIAWSDNLLSSEERALFHALGIFSSGSTVAGAAAVAGLTPDAALELLGSLVDKSLVQRTQNPRIEDRFVMLQTLREYALWSWKRPGGSPARAVVTPTSASPWPSSASAAPRAGPGALVGRAGGGSRGDAHRSPVAQRRGPARRGAPLVRCPGRVLGRPGPLGRRASPAGVCAPPGPGPASLLRAGALHWLGVLEWCLGTLEESRRDHEEAIALCRSAGEDRLLGEGLYRVGLTALFQGDLSALQRVTDALAELAERLSDRRLRGLARSNQSLVAGEVGDVARAVSLADEALEMMRQVGDAYAYGFFQNVRGEMARLAGDEVRARSRTRRSSASPSSSGASASWLSATPTWVRSPPTRATGTTRCNG